MREKPIGLVLDDANQIMDAIARYNGNMRFGYSRRYKARYLRAKEQVAQGRLGRIVGGHARGHSSGRQDRVSDHVHELPWTILTCADGAVISAGIYSGLTEKYPSRGLSSRVELPGIV